MCAACEARLRACGASARNLRLSVTESSMWLDAPTFEGVDAKVGLPTVALGKDRDRARLRCFAATAGNLRTDRRAEVGGPEQRQLEPTGVLVAQRGGASKSRLVRIQRGEPLPFSNCHTAPYLG